MAERAPTRSSSSCKRIAGAATTTRWKFKARPLFGEPGFRRGVELARLGLGAEAKRELALAGIEVPKKRGTITPDPEREELLWLAAVLYDRAGEYAISHFIPRHLLTAYEREWPVGANRKRWLLSYPRGYRELIEKNAALNGQPAALELAIVREESGFDPLMESFANAIGLTQLTAPPAARFAQRAAARRAGAARSGDQRDHRRARARAAVGRVRRAQRRWPSPATTRAKAR